MAASAPPWRKRKKFSTWATTPGTAFYYVSNEFMDLMERADLIIGTGQGNFESLSETGLPVLFLLLAKCLVIAEHLNASVGDVCLKAEGS